MVLFIKSSAAMFVFSVCACRRFDTSFSTWCQLSIEATHFIRMLELYHYHCFCGALLRLGLFFSQNFAFNFFGVVSHCSCVISLTAFLFCNKGTVSKTYTLVIPGIVTGVCTIDLPGTKLY